MQSSLSIYIWDKPETMDRYTIAVEMTGCTTVDIYGCSSKPFHPQGIGQFSHSIGKPILKRDTKHFGKPVDYHALPPNVQRYIRNIITLD